jgi:TPR repeat protein
MTKHLSLGVLFFAACLPTTAFVRTAPNMSERVARPASQVELFIGTKPPKAFIEVGYFERAPSDYVDDKSIDVVNDLRRKAGYEGCEGVVIPSRADLERLAASSTEKARAVCIMFSGAPTLATESVAPPPSEEGACEANQADSCIRLGVAAESAQAFAKADEYYTRACKIPNARGCTHHAILILDGREGVAKDEAAALEQFTKSCILDDAIACRYQGMMHVEGKGGLKRGVAGGITLLDKACQHKDGWACWRIGMALQKGDGVPQDPSRAATYMTLACSNGHQDACTR